MCLSNLQSAGEALSQLFRGGRNPDFTLILVALEPNLMECLCRGFWCVWWRQVGKSKLRVQGRDEILEEAEYQRRETANRFKEIDWLPSSKYHFCGSGEGIT